jgi:putative tricarboxylic transport membrane protein
MTEPDQTPARGGLRSDQLSGLMLLALALYVGWANRAYPLGTLQEPGPGYLPLVLAIFLGSLGIFIASFGYRSAPLASMRWTEAKRALLILVACAAATFALERVGYRITVIALLIFFLGVVERRQPVRVAAVALGFAFASFYVIGDLLHVPLPRSPWGF